MRANGCCFLSILCLPINPASTKAAQETRQYRRVDWKAIFLHIHSLLLFIFAHLADCFGYWLHISAIWTWISSSVAADNARRPAFCSPTKQHKNCHFKSHKIYFCHLMMLTRRFRFEGYQMNALADLAKFNGLQPPLEIPRKKNDTTKHC